MASLLTRTLSVGSYGKDVDGSKRAAYRALDKGDGGTRLKTHMSKSLSVRRTFGAFFRSDVNRLKAQVGWKQNGKVEPLFWARMVREGYPDALAKDLVEQYADEHPSPPPAPKYVEPVLGVDSLDRRLWDEYTTGRNMGLTDLGTFNARSTLPSSGRASDHATSRLSGVIGQPAIAFDLGFSPQIGYDHPVARKFFHLMAGAVDVHYVIVGTKIWSTEKGLHSYTSGGHEGHIHVSGHRR